MRKKIISTRKFIKPSFSYLIEKKRDAGEFSEEEIRYIVDSILDDEIAEYQQSALAMAGFSMLPYPGCPPRSEKGLSQGELEGRLPP